MSSEATGSRTDCGFGGVPDPVSKDRVRGIRIFDISNMSASEARDERADLPRIAHAHGRRRSRATRTTSTSTCRARRGVRSADELPGCADGGPDDPNTARFRLEVIKVPLANPATAAIVSSPRIFNESARSRRAMKNARPGRGGTRCRRRSRWPCRRSGGGAAGAAGGAVAGGAAGAPAVRRAPAQRALARLAQLVRRQEPGRAAGRAGGRGNAGPPTGPNQCHDITVYPDIGLAGGACAGLGLLLDIREAAHPIRIDFVADPNMSFWHSATFSNDGKKVLFSDEWGGGGGPRCRATDKMEWGADAIFTIENNKMVFKSYYKMPAAQTSQENCVAHNGSLIPIPGRDVMVQAWYQGGVSVFDWTDASHPKEIAFFDRGPIDCRTPGQRRLVVGLLVQRRARQLGNRARARHLRAAAERAHHAERDRRGQDREARLPEHAGAAEVRVAAELRAGAARTSISSSARRGCRLSGCVDTRGTRPSPRRQSGGQRRTALTALATQLNADAAGSSDSAKVKMLAAAVTDLAK